MQKIVITNSSDETERIAELIGSKLHGGEVIELKADLGGGKTTFTRGLARGAKSSDVVASPTFTVSRVYEAQEFEIHHFDFYRLADPGLIAHELEDLVGDPGVVVVVEWADGVQHVLPENRLTVKFDHVDEAQRQLSLECSSTLDYLVESVT